MIKTCDNKIIAHQKLVEVEAKKGLRFKMCMQALQSTSNAILSTCQRTFPAFCRAASLSPHTLLSASLCPTFFPIVFLFLFCIQPRGGGHCSWVLASFQDTKTVVWPHFWSRLLHSQPKVYFCPKNETSKKITDKRTDPCSRPLCTYCGIVSQ